MKLIAAGVLVIVLGIAGGFGWQYYSSKWPDETRTTFVTSCAATAGLSRAFSGKEPAPDYVLRYCECTLAAAERRWTADEFKQLELRMLAGGMTTPPELAEIAQPCVGEASVATKPE